MHLRPTWNRRPINATMFLMMMMTMAEGGAELWRSYGLDPLLHAVKWTNVADIWGKETRDAA